MNFGAYQTGDFYDELFRSAETPREEFRMLVERIDSLPEGELLRRQRVAERDLMHMGSRSTSTETREARNASFHSIWCLGSSPPTNGIGWRRGYSSAFAP